MCVCVCGHLATRACMYIYDTIEKRIYYSILLKYLCTSVECM